MVYRRNDDRVQSTTIERHEHVRRGGVLRVRSVRAVLVQYGVGVVLAAVVVGVSARRVVPSVLETKFISLSVIIMSVLSSSLLPLLHVVVSLLIIVRLSIDPNDAILLVVPI